MSKVAIVGGCGRIGLRTSLIAASKAHNISIIDIDEEKLNELRNGSLPHLEEDADIYLEEVLKNKLLSFSSSYDSISKSEVIIIAIGTPVDSNLNPGLEPIAGVIFDIAEFLKKKQTLIFRGNLSPEITLRVKTLIEEKTGYRVGKDIFLVFAPELLNQNGQIHELTKIAQPIGAFDENSFNAATSFFKTITKGRINWLSPEEAILTRLMKNVNAYIQTACANEFYLIAESFGANYQKIVDACGDGNIKNANPNVSGPGSHKEGWFLVEKIPFADLTTTAFKINESIPSQIIKKIESFKPEKVVILGMSNKANSDDYKSSLSYKLRKSLYYKDYTVGCFDPNLPEYSDSSVLNKADAIILMTPHEEFRNLDRITKLVNNPNCVVIDISGFWNESRELGNNGLFKLSQLKAAKK